VANSCYTGYRAYTALRALTAHRVTQSRSVDCLAEEMEQGPFDEFLRDYYQSYKWGIGTCGAFRQLAERHCRCDLSAMFEEWVYRR
jgi:hypothetical protein